MNVKRRNLWCCLIQLLLLFAIPLIACAQSFGKDTTLLALVPDLGGRFVERFIDQIKPKDEVLTMTMDNQLTTTRVVHNIKHSGESFDCFEFQVALSSGGNTSIRVTPNHGLVTVSVTGELVLSLARDIHIGNLLMSSLGQAEVKSGKRVVADEMYTLITVEGTMLASELLVSTMCDEEGFAPGSRLPDVVQVWQAQHHYDKILYDMMNEKYR